MPKLHAVRMACNLWFGHWILGGCSPWRIAVSHFLPLFCHEDLKLESLHVGYCLLLPETPYFLHSTPWFSPRETPSLVAMVETRRREANSILQVNIRMPKARTILALIMHAKCGLNEKRRIFYIYVTIPLIDYGLTTAIFVQGSNSLPLLLSFFNLSRNLVCQS